MVSYTVVITTLWMAGSLAMPLQDYSQTNAATADRFAYQPHANEQATYEDEPNGNANAEATASDYIVDDFEGAYRGERRFEGREPWKVSGNSQEDAGANDYSNAALEPRSASARANAHANAAAVAQAHTNLHTNVNITVKRKQESPLNGLINGAMKIVKNVKHLQNTLNPWRCTVGGQTRIIKSYNIRSEDQDAGEGEGHGEGHGEAYIREQVLARSNARARAHAKASAKANASSGSNLHINIIEKTRQETAHEGIARGLGDMLAHVLRIPIRAIHDDDYGPCPSDEDMGEQESGHIEPTVNTASGKRPVSLDDE